MTGEDPTVAAILAEQINRHLAEVPLGCPLDVYTAYVIKSMNLLASAARLLTQQQEVLDELRAHADYSLQTGGQRTRAALFLFVPSVAKRVLEIINRAAPSPDDSTPRERTP